MIDSRYFLIFIMAICWVLVFIIAYKGKKQEETVRKSKETADIIYEAQLETDDYEKKVCQLIKEIKSKINDYSELSGLSEKCKSYTGDMLTDIPAVNGLITYKKNACNTAGIRFDVFIYKIPRNVLDEYEMISLLGNLLDNAIEAAARCQPDSRYVSFESRIVKGRWLIKTENSKLSSESPLLNDMATTKEDKENHGIGTKIIKRIIKQNKGDLKLRDHGSSFEVSVLIPVKARKKENVESIHM